MNKNFPDNLVLKVKDISRGGFGVLSLYEDKKTKKKYMVKELYRKDPRQYRNLEYIKDICKKFYVCPEGMYEKDGKYYIITEYLDGFIPLRQSKELFSMKEKENILKKIQKEIELLHQKNMTHNDIKPDNIMVNPKTKKVRIIDFGSAIIHSFFYRYRLADVGYTKKYTKLDPHKYYFKNKFIENDLYALSLIRSWYKN